MDGVSRLVELYIVDKVKGRRDETRRGNPEQQARPESGRVWFACTGLGWAGLVGRSLQRCTAVARALHVRQHGVLVRGSSPIKPSSSRRSVVCKIGGAS